MKKTGLLVFIIVSLISGVLGDASASAAGEDKCEGAGIVLGNQSMLDLWYRRSGGDCAIWIHEHTLIIKPKDVVGIFYDMTCDKRFCGGDITYDTLWKIDVSRDCSARILPDCKLSDM